MTQAVPPQPLTHAQRSAVLDAALDKWLTGTSGGGKWNAQQPTIVSRSAHQVVLTVYPRQALSNVWWALIVIATCGSFVVFWLIDVLTSRPRTYSFDVSPTGEIKKTRIKYP
ncbi:hypothetical protein A5634_07420 [Mycobacterium asiaticum]|uniref:Uncharacterized protein n=1 Tax=Mycobacterium asiaticum TaxID=1790 RepID=A0A1A3NJE3_MYCAS|nr:hypothetical protein [Mycobacterium asiaticum]OBK22278.1 hypothetical protein A5634_07420 [Mycobacterium asiaticum]